MTPTPTQANYWDRFAKVTDSIPKTSTDTVDYWQRFTKVAEGAAGNQTLPAHQETSFLSQAKRLGGLAAHGLAQGVGGLVNLANVATKDMEGGFALENSPTGPDDNHPPYDLKDYQPEQVASILGEKVNALFGTNLEPQDAVEKFVHLLGEFSVPLGVGGKAATLGGKLLKLGKHEALAAGGAAGVTAAEEAGVESSLGKIASGVGGTAAVSALGAIHPKTVALTLAGFGKKKLKAEALQAAQRIGVDLPGVAANDAVLPAAAHNLISRVPYFGDQIRESLTKTGAQLQQSFAKLLDQVSPPLKEELSQAAQKIYAPLEKLLPATDTIDPRSWLEEIQRLETKLKSVAKSEPTKKLLEVFKEIKQNLSNQSTEALPEYLATASETVKQSLEKQLPNGSVSGKAIPVSEVVRQKIEFNKMMRDKNLFDRSDSDSLSYLHKLQAVTKEMLEQYGQQQNPAFLKALKQADQQYGAYAKRQNLEELLEEPLKGLITEQPQYNTLIKALQKKGNQKFLKNNLGEENYKKLKDYVDVAKAMESIKRNNQNPSGSGWVGALASIAGGLYAAPAYTTALLAATQGGTKLLTSKKFINLAHQYPKKPSESLAKKLETVIKETTGKSANILNQELGEIQKRHPNLQQEHP